MKGLPDYHHKDDREFIRTNVNKLPAHWRGQVLGVYSDKYKDVYFNEPNPARRENAARKAANKWLLGYVKKYETRYLQSKPKDG